MTTVIGLLHPGEMGASVGTALRAGGARVLWTSQGRAAATRARAEAAGLEDTGPLADLVRQSETILSVCPPHAALDVARAVASLGFRGLYVDGNAVSPATTLAVGAALEGAGATFVDGGIIGPPPREHGMTRVYLAGPEARRVAALFERGPFEAIVLDGPVGAASALKMAYAAWNKGSAALLMAVRALAGVHGVEDALAEEWRRSAPDLPARLGKTVEGTVRKAWRFAGEMDEIAATFEATGLPGGFGQAAAEVYRRLDRYKDTPATPAVADVAAAIARAAGNRTAGPA